MTRERYRKKLTVKAVSASFVDGRWSQDLPAWDSPSTLVTLFFAPSFGKDSTVIQDVVRKYPNSIVVGCSTSGEIDGTTVRDDSIVATFMRFAHTSIRRAVAVVDIPSDSYDAGRTLAGCLDDEDLRAVFVLSEGVHVNGTALVAGFNDVLADDVIVTGGLAADGDRFETTWVLAGWEPEERTTVAVGFYGDRIHVGHGSKGGWDIFGPERTVTRSTSNIVYEFDSQPALVLYKEYLGELAAGLPATGLLFPLAIRDGSDEDVIVRTLLGIDEAEQSLVFAGDVPQGSIARLMRSNFERLVDGAEQAARLATDADTPDGDIVAIAVSCVGRRLVLGERTEEEVEATLDVLPENVHQVGFYSYGEISPHVGSTCELHNQTMTLTTIMEV